MKFSLTGQEKGDLLIEVTAMAGLTAYVISHIIAENLTTKQMYHHFKINFIIRQQSMS